MPVYKLVTSDAYCHYGKDYCVNIYQLTVFAKTKIHYSKLLAVQEVLTHYYIDSFHIKVLPQPSHDTLIELT